MGLPVCCAWQISEINVHLHTNHFLLPVSVLMSHIAFFLDVYNWLIEFYYYYLTKKITIFDTARTGIFYIHFCHDTHGGWGRRHKFTTKQKRSWKNSRKFFPSFEIFWPNSVEQESDRTKMNRMDELLNFFGLYIFF